MFLIVMTGLPGTGKSAIAESLGRTLKIPVFAKDWLEATLLQNDVRHEKLGYIGYEILTMLARRQMHLNQSVILDSVASLETIRGQWRSLAAEYGADYRIIECICSDEKLHFSRVVGRQREIPGWPELTWDDIERVRGYYEPWQEKRLVLDAVYPFQENLQKAIDYIK